MDYEREDLPATWFLWEEPSPALSEAVMLALAFAEHGSLPGQDRRPGHARFTNDDFRKLEPRILAGLAELYALVAKG